MKSRRALGRRAWSPRSFVRLHSRPAPVYFHGPKKRHPHPESTPPRPRHRCRQRREDASVFDLFPRPAGVVPRRWVSPSDCPALVAGTFVAVEWRGEHSDHDPRAITKKKERKERSAARKALGHGYSDRNEAVKECFLYPPSSMTKKKNKNCCRNPSAWRYSSGRSKARIRVRALAWHRCTTAVLYSAPA